MLIKKRHPSHAKQWIEVENPPGKRHPKWFRSAGLSDVGVVFLPGAIGGDEKNTTLCAGQDGTPIVHYLKHAYFPAQWLAKKFPKSKEVCERIEARVREIYVQSREDN